jgi:two-component system nitrogen regulation sensor histidine kinase NtrY
LKTNLKYIWITLAVSLGLFAAAFVAERNFYKKKITGIEVAASVQKIKSVLNRKEKDFNRLVEKHVFEVNNKFYSFKPEYTAQFKEKNLALLVYSGDSLIYWSDNSVLIDTSREIPLGVSLQLLKNGWYQVIKIRGVVNTFYGLYEVKSQYAFENQYLTNNFNPELGIDIDGVLYNKAVAGAHEILSLSGVVVGHVKFDNGPDFPPYLWMYYLLGFLVFLVFLQFVFISYQHSKNRWWVFGSIVFFLVLVRFLGIHFHFPSSLYNYYAFKPQIYASSSWLPSMADLIINVFLLFFVVYNLYRYVLTSSFSAKLRSSSGILLMTGFLLGLMLFTLLVFRIIQSQVLDSKISFDFNYIVALNFNTLIGLTTTGILLTAHLIVVNTLFYLSGEMKVRRHFKTAALPALLLFAACVFFLVNFSLFLLLPIFYLLGMIMFMMFFWKTGKVQKIAFYVVWFSLISAILFNLSNYRKELENRKLFAARLTSQNDVAAEYLFADIEKKIIKDNFIVEYYTQPLFLKSQLENKLKNLYFTGYLSKYDVRIYDFDSLGNSFKEKNTMSFAELATLFNLQSSPTLSKSFNYITNPAYTSSYISKFEYNRNNNCLGTVFILLKPKLIQDENLFPELLNNGNIKTSRQNNNYSYAIYKYGELVNQSGAFPYKLSLNDNPENEFYHFTEFKEVTRSGYAHLVYKETESTIIFVSRKAEGIIHDFSVFSFLLIFFTFFFVLLFMTRHLFFLLQSGWPAGGSYLGTLLNFMRVFRPNIESKVVLFKTRIQITLLAVVLLTLILSVYITISYISISYKNSQSEKLTGKIRSLLNVMENESRFQLDVNDHYSVAALINQFSDFYRSDINLFSLDGSLMASTKDKVFESGIISQKMNPAAFYDLVFEHKSTSVQNERIGNLNYISAYVPVLSSSNNVIAYLNLPYFSKEVELDNEIFSFVVSFINLYVILFVLVGIVAYFISKNMTAPLTLIQDKLKRTALGRPVETIDWHRNDEIGKLIKQYNKMVNDLSASAELLAKSERELAWKEMAKQIAHEIKNPLTPMKLSVQHLQRTWKDRSPKLEETFHRVTAVLIEQIESLSELASEFSDFAKMPPAKYQKINVAEVVQSVIHLYAHTGNTEIRLEKSSGEASVFIDRDQLSRVFNNLVKNAIQAIPEGKHGLVEIKITVDNDSVNVEVKDNGSGIPPEVAAKIFTPNFSTKTSGMGLGLAIVNKIVESADGTISFESSPEEGTTFIVSFPRFNGQ